jgi:hypothetical protein
MHPFRTHRLPRTRLAWLVWLALLLPVAQYAAALHGLSHAVQQSQGDDKQAPHYPHCELCVTAAEVAAGALPSLPPTLQVPASHHAPLHTLAHRAARSHAPLPYFSRGPPLTPR